MAGAHRSTQHGPRNYLAGGNIRGNHLVEANPDNGTVVEAQPGSTLVLGVAMADAVASRTEFPDGDTPLDMAQAAIHVAVDGRSEFWLPAEVRIEFGDPVCVGADAQVSNALPDGGDPTGRAVIGTCTAPQGIDAGKRGKVLLNR